MRRLGAFGGRLDEPDLSQDRLGGEIVGEDQIHPGRGEPISRGTIAYGMDADDADPGAHPCAETGSRRPRRLRSDYDDIDLVASVEHLVREEGAEDEPHRGGRPGGGHEARFPLPGGEDGGDA
ncbi:MAG TPA: hypothetical protein DCY40_01895 [Actinobacteria bacterium]|nr:hypothetical protein [Actinomycetota bacterium]